MLLKISWKVLSGLRGTCREFFSKLLKSDKKELKSLNRLHIIEVSIFRSTSHWSIFSWEFLMRIVTNNSFAHSEMNTIHLQTLNVIEEDSVSVGTSMSDPHSVTWVVHIGETWSYWINEIEVFSRTTIKQLFNSSFKTCFLQAIHSMHLIGTSLSSKSWNRIWVWSFKMRQMS